MKFMRLIYNIFASPIGFRYASVCSHLNTRWVCQSGVPSRQADCVFPNGCRPCRHGGAFEWLSAQKATGGGAGSSRRDGQWVVHRISSAFAERALLRSSLQAIAILLALHLKCQPIEARLLFAIDL